MKATRKLISYDELRQILHYEPETGIWTWLKHSKPALTGTRAGSLGTKGYRRICLGSDETEYAEHRLAWFYMTGEWPVDEIDHEDTDKANNKWQNLRQANRFQNMSNRGAQKRNKTGLKGVSSYEHRGLKRPFMATIKCEKKYIYLGYFETAEQAHQAYCRKAAELQGAFFPSSILDRPG